MPLRSGLRVIALAGLVAAIGAACSWSQVGFNLEEETGLQWLFLLRGTRPVPPEAVVVRFDRDALSRLRDLPADASAWPRAAGRMRGTPRSDHRPCRRHASGPAAARGVGLPGGAACRPRCRGDGVRHLVSPRSQPRGGRTRARQRHPRPWAGDPARPCRPAARPAGPAKVATGGDVQADWLERPHATLAAAAIATAPMMLPRGSSQIHQFWAFNTALPYGDPAADAGARGDGSAGAGALGAEPPRSRCRPRCRRPSCWRATRAGSAPRSRPPTAA